MAKERPAWMKHSTVHPSSDLVQDRTLVGEAALTEPSQLESVVEKTTIGGTVLIVLITWPWFRCSIQRWYIYYYLEYETIPL